MESVVIHDHDTDKYRDAFGPLTFETDKTETLNFVINNGGQVLASGIQGDVVINSNCTITDWVLLTNPSGTLIMDIWKTPYSTFPPTVSNSITASSRPIVSSGTHNTNSTLSGWTTTINAGDILRFNINTVSAVQKATLSLKLLRST